MRTQRSGRGESVKSVEKAGALLHALSRNGAAGMSGSALAALTGVSKPAAYRILRALERIGFVARNDDGYLTIGVGMREIAIGPSWEEQLRRVALPVMQHLRSTTSETVSLYVPRTAYDIVCVETLTSTMSVRYESTVGNRVATALGATGTVLLAELARTDGMAAVRNVLGGLTQSELPPGGISTVLERLPRAVESYCSTIGERIPGSAAIAAPIRRNARRAVAVLTISGPVQRFTPAAIEELHRHIIDAAARITARLG